MQIDKEEYIKLRVAAETLSRLEAAGVDNWEGYSLSDKDGPTLEEFEENLRKELDSGTSKSD